ncbi:hypothetical protein CHH83_01975 [Bacillus sp. 7586-K]|nr:hypothetical protein CHH83_01975 [Bacillus sp. 7586-K]
MNCYDSNEIVQKFDLLVAEDTEFNLTRNRVYVARGAGFGGIVKVINDKGIEEEYSEEYFRFYQGEAIY